MEGYVVVPVDHFVRLDSLQMTVNYKDRSMRHSHQISSFSMSYVKVWIVVGP